MRKLLSAALLFAGLVGVPGVASAHDRDGWRDGDRHEWRDRDWRRDRWERKHWKQHRRWAYRHDGWRYRYHRPYAYRDNLVCRTRWDYHGYPHRVCWRRW